MLTLSLVSLVPSVETDLIESQFLEMFGDEQVELDLKDIEAINELEDKTKSLFDLLDYAGDEVYLLIADRVSMKARKVDSWEELNFFIRESRSISDIVTDGYPLEGNYWDASGYDAYGNIVPMATVDDIYDDAVFTTNLSDDKDIKMIPTVLIAPSSWNDGRGVGMEIDPEHSSDVAVRDRLASKGVVFPFMNEAQLLQEFDRLSKMNEVDDSDLISLLRLGYDEMKAAIGNTSGKIGDFFKGSRDFGAKAVEVIGKIAEKRKNAKVDRIKKNIDRRFAAMEKLGKDAKPEDIKKLTDEIKQEAEKLREIDKDAYNEMRSEMPEPPEPPAGATNDEDDSKPVDSVAKDKPTDSEDSEDSEKQEIKDIIDKVKSDVSRAKAANDESMKKARSRVQALKDADKAAYKKAKALVDKKAEKLRDRKSDSANSDKPNLRLVAGQELR